MPKKPKKKLTPAQRRERKRRKEEFQTIFINGKQKRVRREPMVDGLPVDEFIRRNADPIWLHQHEMWEYMEPEGPGTAQPNPSPARNAESFDDTDDEIDIPF